MRTPLSLLATLLLGAAAVLAGCSVGLESLPAPAGIQGPTYGVTADFAQVENLTEGAKVKVGGAVIGEVSAITTHDYRAQVAMRIEQGFPLGRDARFQIRFSTPLGDDFVAVTSRGDPSRGRLADGAHVGIAHTDAAPSIEDTFAALSTLLNGGGLSNLQTIVTELTTALHGRTGDARAILVRLDRLVANLDAHKDDIDAVLTGLQHLGSELNRGTGTIEHALRLFPPVVRFLAADTHRIRDLLARVGDLGHTVRGLLRRGQQALLTDFANLRPTLDRLRQRSGELLPTFRSLIALGRSIDRAAPGDYLNVSATIQFLLNAHPARPHPGGVVHPGSESGNAAVTRPLVGGMR